MPNPTLNTKQLKQAHVLLMKIRKQITKLAGNSKGLVYAYKKKIRKELMYDERSKPSVRRKLKEYMWKKQKGTCALCRKKLPVKYSELDRFQAIKGYVEKNVRLVHHDCHVTSQARKKYK